MRQKRPENSDFPRCAWCDLPIRCNPLSMEDKKARVRVYHEDCYRYGLTLEPEKIGWTPFPRRSRTSPPRG